MFSLEGVEVSKSNYEGKLFKLHATQRYELKLMKDV